MAPSRIARLVLVLATASVAVLGGHGDPPLQVPSVEASPQPPLPSPPHRHVVPVDGHPVTVWSRVASRPVAVALLVHGRTWSSRPDFDLQVPGIERSVLSSLAARGVTAYAVDLRGYGGTPRDDTGWLTPSRAATDVIGVLTWVRARHRDLPPPALIGWSRGAAVAMLAAQRAPTLASSLVLFGFAFEPGSRFVDLVEPDAKPQRVPNAEAAARSDFISPAVTPPAIIRAFVAQALAADPVMVDLRGDDEFSELDPARVAMPVLVIYGDRDPTLSDTTVHRLTGAFDDGRVVVLRGADHAAHLENTHEEWVEAVGDFVIGR